MPLVSFTLAEQGSFSSVREKPIVKTVEEMLDLDPFKNEVPLLCFLSIMSFSFSSRSSYFNYVFSLLCSLSSLFAL